MHRKGSPIALIRAADHLGRQGSQSEPPFVPPLKPAAAHTATKLAAPRITGAPRTGHPDFTIRIPISPSGPQFHHPNSTSHLPPPPERGGEGRNLPGLAAPSAARPRPRRAAGLPTGRARPRAVPRPRSAARIHGDAARGRGRGAATRWRRRLANAGGAGSCQKSRSQIGSFFPLKVKVSGLPRPVIAANAPTFPRPSPRPRGLAAPLPFSGEGCSAALVSSSSSSPWPQPLCKTSP